MAGASRSSFGAPQEHEWAVAVERTGTRLGIPLKEGLGPADLKEYFRLASYGIYLDSLDIQPDSEFLAEFAAARLAADPYFAVG